MNITKMDKDEWQYEVEPSTYSIHNFDDGNEKYKAYDNKWIIFGRWRGKCALVNKIDPTIKINSISDWKILCITR